MFMIATSINMINMIGRVTATATAEEDDEMAELSAWAAA